MSFTFSCSVSHESRVRDLTLDRWTPRLLGTGGCHVFWGLMGRRRCDRCAGLPVDPGALDAHGDAQVDGGPARLLLPAVTAHVVPGAPEGHAQRLRPLSRGTRPGGGVSTRGRRGRLSGLHTDR